MEGGGHIYSIFFKTEIKEVCYLIFPPSCKFATLIRYVAYKLILSSDISWVWWITFSGEILRGAFIVPGDDFPKFSTHPNPNKIEQT